MQLRALSALLAACVAFGAVGYVASEPLTTIEAVPDPRPAPTSQPPAPLARGNDMPREGSPSPFIKESFDPYNAATPEPPGQTAVPVPLPTAPKQIATEKVKSLGTPAPGTLLTRPVNGRTTSKFGMRFHPILRIWKLHTGLDWAVPCGTPVGAAAKGTVVKAGWAGGNGIQVKIDHGMLAGIRVVTTYNHLSSIGVSVGQQVEALDGVGRVGNTGYSTGCHMHFEVIANGQFTDPEPWLNGNPVVVDLDGMDLTVPTASPSASPSPSLLPSASPSPSVSPSPSPTPSVSPTPTPTVTPSLTPTPSPSVIPTPKPSPSATTKPSPSPSPTPSPSPSPTPSPTPTPTPSPSPSPPEPNPTPSSPPPPSPTVSGATSPSASATPQSTTLSAQPSPTDTQSQAITPSPTELVSVP